MKTFTYNGSAEQFIEVLDYVEAYREEAMTTRAGHEFIVVSPLSEYKSLRETMYLMNSPTNTRHLMDLIAHLEQHIHKAGAVSLSKSSSMLSDKETAPDMGNDSMYMSLLNVTPVDRLDSGRWGFP
ncbi:type II toxin-antitoxin system Phd/YefM family antitoxin [Rothia dentocariosa]|uniref:type II toxin-antitoxin system Phd/YefM family antitoxin n=1 Tax=Rothia dentocariosa TaxID=2047 RepID=UPI003A8C4932